MGTRADFYVGRGESAEWLGSIAWDGYPDGIPLNVRDAQTPSEWRECVLRFLAGREDATLPADGWPWPWEDSSTTDYAYAFDEGRVWGACFGYSWWPVHEEVEDEDETEQQQCVFPTFSRDRAAMPGDKRSGMMVFTARRDP